MLRSLTVFEKMGAISNLDNLDEAIGRKMKHHNLDPTTIHAMSCTVKGLCQCIVRLAKKAEGKAKTEIVERLKATQYICSRASCTCLV